MRKPVKSRERGSGGGSLDRENLTVAIPACGGIDDMGEMEVAGFVAAKLRQIATVCGTAHAQAHLRCFAFRDSHGVNSPV
jgi:hypothetical protein